MSRQAELIKSWEKPDVDRDRYGRVPPVDAPMLAIAMELPDARKEQIIAHVFRQSRPVHAWVMARANKYFEHGVKADDCEWRACVDVIAWQRLTGGLEAVKFVMELPSAEELGMK